jgi:hypothetical protein
MNSLVDRTTDVVPRGLPGAGEPLDREVEVVKVVALLITGTFLLTT